MTQAHAPGGASELIGGVACKQAAAPAEKSEAWNREDLAHREAVEGGGEGPNLEREHPIVDREVCTLSVSLWPLGKIEIRVKEANQVARSESWSLTKLVRAYLERAYGGLVGRSSQGVIGWLQEKSMSLSTLDVTEEFERNLAKILQGEDDDLLGTNYDYLFIPGYLWRWIPTGQYFTESLSVFNANGLNAFYADAIASEGTVDANAAVLRRLLLQMHEKRGNQIVLIGHSKGGVDALAAVARYKSELAPIVRGIVCLQSPIGGSPVASDLVFGNSAINLFCKSIYSIVGSDFESLRDLTYDSRRKFFARWGQHWPVQQVPVLCFSSKLCDNAPAPCSISRLLAAPATYIGLRYGHMSDGAVTEGDAELPGTMVVRAKGALSHMSTVLPSPKGGLVLSGHKVEAWQINKAAVATILSQSNKSRYRRSNAFWGTALPGWLRGATTDDLHAYEHAHSSGGKDKLSSNMPRSRSYESFSWSPLPAQSIAKPPVSFADKASKRYHLSKCTSSVGDEFARAHTAATEKPAPRVRMEKQAAVPKRKFARSETFTIGSKAKLSGYLSQEPWMQQAPRESIDSIDSGVFESLVGKPRRAIEDAGCNPPTPLKDVNPPPQARRRGLVGTLLGWVWL